MPRHIVLLNIEGTQYFLDWSTVVDAPVFGCKGKSDFISYYRNEYGLQKLPERMKRVLEKGTSSMLDDSADDVIFPNKAGHNETCMTKQQIIDYYCLDDTDTDLPLGLCKCNNNRDERCG